MHQYNGSIDSFTHEIVDLKERVRILENEIAKLKKKSTKLEEDNKVLQHKLHVTIAERERLKLRIEIMNKNIDNYSKKSMKYANNMPPNLIKLKQELLGSLNDLIPNPENHSRYSEVINEIFENYSYTKERIEKLKEENFEFSNKFDDEPE
jgi:chromosome segregation ATPase